MVNYLADLSDYLDKSALYKQANIVDTFIAKVSQNVDIKNKSLPKTFTVRFSDMGFLDLKKHPLGQKILNYVMNCFLVADEGSSDGLVSVKEINEIVAETSLYDEDLRHYDSLDKNPNPISPIQFKFILTEAQRLYRSEYKENGDLDKRIIDDLLDTLYKNYEDMYLEKYIGFKSEEDDYLLSDYNQQKPMTRPELLKHPKEIEYLNRENDRALLDAQQEVQLKEWEKEQNPKMLKRKQEEELNKMKRQHPEEWHNILFDK